MSACPADEILGEFLDGSLPDGPAKAVESHLDECDECRQLVSTLVGGSDSTVELTTEAERTRSGADLEPGELVGPYLIGERLGEGGMGVVFAAFDPRLDRRVAIKVLRAAGPGSRIGLLREAQALARLSHPNVVTVHDVGAVEGERVYLAMELVDGRPLREWIDESPPWREVVRVFAAAARGLEAAHAAGLIHGDVKPGNFLLGRDGRVRVTDFGLARLAADPGGRKSGTPGYLAPEVLAGSTGDARSDQYAFSVALHEALFGVRPGQASKRRPPQWLARIVARGLDPDPKRRHPSLGTIAKALESDPWVKRRLVFAGASLFAVAAVIAIGPRFASLCDGGEEAIEDAWGAGRRAEVKAAFDRAGGPLAADSWIATERSLDRYASRWVGMHGDACRAVRVTRVQTERQLEQRMTCLRARRDELASLTHVLAGADAPLIRRSPQVIAGLVPIERCADLATLAQIVEPPATDEARREVERIRVELGNARELRIRGRYEEGRHVAEPLAASARTLAWRPLEAEVLYLLADLHFATLDRSVAKEHFTASALAAEAGRDDATKTRALIKLATLAAQLGELDEADLRLREAAATVERLGAADDVLRADLILARGTLEVERGRYTEAIEFARAALALLERAPEGREYRIAMALNNIGGMQGMSGEFAQAEASLRRASAVADATFGRHPDLAGLLHTNLGSVLTELGRHEEALAESRIARKIYEDTVGPASEDVADLWMNEGVILKRLGHAEEALDAGERAIAIYGPSHPSSAMTRLNTVEILVERGEVARAEAEARRAVELLDRTIGRDHPINAIAHTTLGETLLAAGKKSEARLAFEIALRVKELPERERVRAERGISATYAKR